MGLPKIAAAFASSTKPSGYACLNDRAAPGPCASANALVRGRSAPARHTGMPTAAAPPTRRTPEAPSGLEAPSPPTRLQHRGPARNERQGPVMMPPRPCPHLGVGQPGLACAALQAAPDPMLDRGHSRPHPRKRPRRGVGEVIIVPGRPILVRGPDHHQRLFRPDPSQSRSRHHPRRDQFHGLRASLAGHLDPLPSPRRRAYDQARTCTNARYGCSPRPLHSGITPSSTTVVTKFCD